MLFTFEFNSNKIQIMVQYYIIFIEPVTFMKILLFWLKVILTFKTIYSFVF